MCYILALMVLEPGINVLWISQDEDNANAIRNKFRVIWKSVAKSPGSGFQLDDILNDNPGQFGIRNGSVLNIRFAGDTKRRASNVSRGDTIHFAVFTEVAYWPHAAAVFEAMSPSLAHAKPSIVWDTTPNGTTGDGEFFYKRVMACLEGRMNGVVHFWSWWQEPRYARPCSGWDELGLLDDQEQFLRDKKGLSPQQIKWRRFTITELNDDETAFKEIYPESFEEAWRSKGKTIFDKRVLRRRINELSDRKLAETGYGACPPQHLPEDLIGNGVMAKIMTSRTLKESGGLGYFRLWQKYDKTNRYFAGGDTSQGLPDSDWMTLTVIDRNCKIVAMLRCKIRSVLYAGLAQRIIEYFNADSGVENQSTGPEICRYLREELTETEVGRYGADDCLMRSVKCELVPNNRAARPILVTHLQQSIDGGLCVLPDMETLREAMNFERKADGKIEAATGENDDILLSLAIALRIREIKSIRDNPHDNGSFYSGVGRESPSRSDYFGGQADWTPGGRTRLGIVQGGREKPPQGNDPFGVSKTSRSDRRQAVSEERDSRRVGEPHPFYGQEIDRVRRH